MSLKIDHINGAYSQLRISGLTVNPTPENISNALDRFESMRQGKSIDQIEDELRFSGQSAEFTGPVRNAVQSIMINAPEGKGQVAMDFIDDLVSSGDTEGAKNQIKRLARAQAGTAESKNVAGKERTLGLLDEIQDDIATLEAQGINTNIFSGTAEQVAGKIGKVREPGLRELATKIATGVQNYRRSMSGVAFSVPESKDYERIFPSVSKTGALNTANINALKDVISGDLESFYSLAMGNKTYKDLFQEEEPEIQEASQAGVPQWVPEGS